MQNHDAIVGSANGYPGDTFTKNQHADLRADYILANPPFNISDWWHGSLMGDAGGNPDRARDTVRL